MEHGDRPAFLLPGLRSPFAKTDRELAHRTALQLSAPVIQQTVLGERGPGPDGVGGVDLVLWGAVIPDLAVSNWGREAWLESGLDASVPAQGVVQACATSLAALTHAAGGVRSGTLELALCGGVEAVSQTQVGLSRGLSRTIRRVGTARGPGDALRTLGELRPRDLGLQVPAVEERTTGMSMGEHCEEMATDWEIPREEQDRFALESHEKAAAARAEGFFRPLLTAPGTFPLGEDGLVRPDTSMEQLAGLSPAFHPRGTLTAGNSSPLTDGAAAAWMASSRGLERLPDDLPRVRLVDWEQAAVDPRRDGLLMAPALALPRLLSRHDLAYDDVELWEVHEAFAAQVLCTYAALDDPDWVRERAGVERPMGRVPRERVNPHGGSLSLGHPFGATGARIASQAATELSRREPGSLGLVSICAAGGLGHVALLEAV